MHTLLLDGTLMDSLGDVVTNLGKDSWIFVIIFYIFVLLSALTVMNMLIGVLCEVVSAVAATEREEITVGFVKEKLQEIMEQGVDQDGDNKVSKIEFMQILENPEAIRVLNDVGVDAVGLVDMADEIFKGNDDNDEEDAVLTFPDFMEVVLQLRGSNTATVKDIVDLRKFMRSSIKHLEEKMVHQRKVKCANDGESQDVHATVSNTHALTDALTNGEEIKITNGHHCTNADAMSMPFFSSNESIDNLVPDEQMWVRAARLEGVLAAGQSELQRFLESLFLNHLEATKLGNHGSAGCLKDGIVPLILPGMMNHCKLGPDVSNMDITELEAFHLQMIRLGEVLTASMIAIQHARERVFKALPKGVPKMLE